MPENSDKGKTSGTDKKATPENLTDINPDFTRCILRGDSDNSIGCILRGGGPDEAFVSNEDRGSKSDEFENCVD